MKVNMLILSTQYVYKIHKHFLPKSLLTFWIKSTVKHIPNFDSKLNLNIRFVDSIEGKELNKNYRLKDYATNVLTFVYDDIDENINSDIILCCDVLEKEALTENKAIVSHYAHLIVHGVLHACGYEHDTDEDNEEMQALETKIMLYLGFHNPYKD